MADERTAKEFAMRVCPNGQLNTGRVMSPPRAEMERLRTPLTVGEQRVLELFDNYLPQEWEIYVQPHLNGQRPDFVLLHPNVGIAIFEVKDWDLRALNYTVRQGHNGPVLHAADRNGREFSLECPVEQALRYRARMAELYCPRLARKIQECPNALSLLSVGVIMTEATTREAQALFAPFMAHHGLLDSPKAQYHRLAGRELLERGDVTAIFPDAARTVSYWMTPEIASDARSWLAEPDVSAEQRESLPLDERQSALIASYRRQPGQYRLRGAAGSGKSLMLAALAADLSAQGEVLAVTYNITLCHYLRDLAARRPAPGRRLNAGITWTHFHGWCRDICESAGLRDDYFALMGEADEDSERRKALFETRIPALVGTGLDHLGSRAPTYDAVLVDEGQDFQPAWWNLLRRVCRSNGRMLLTADRAQDVYGRKAWTEERMVGSGFTGRWSELRGSYRLPADLIPHLRRFLERFQPAQGAEIPEPIQQELDLYPTTLRWIQTPPEGAAAACAQSALELPGQAGNGALHYADVTLLVYANSHGTQSLDLLKPYVGVAHTFGATWQERRHAKLFFFKGDPRMKATTIYSFKGWESRSLVVRIDRADSEQAIAAIYVGLTRLKRHPEGSFLTVVCAAPELESYGRTWPNFESSVSGLSLRPVVSPHGRLALPRSAEPVGT